MELASSRMSASQAASRAGSIRTLTREADAIDMQVARLTGEVETLTPRLTEFDNEIDKLAQQIELAAEAGEDLRQMEATRASRASTARAEAAAIAERIRETVNAIDGTRTGTVIPAGEQATQSLERAMRESEKAARGIREAGTLGKAAAQRRLAELYQLRADGHARYADMLAKIGSMNELPNADSYTQASVSERATADDLIIFAAESYENAATSLASVNVRGTDPQRAAETADELNNLARRLRGNPHRRRTSPPPTRPSINPRPRPRTGTTTASPETGLYPMTNSSPNTPTDHAPETSVREPTLPAVTVNVVRPTDPVIGRVVSNELCTKGGTKAAGFVRHVAIDVSGTPLAGSFVSGQSFGVLPRVRTTRAGLTNSASTRSRARPAARTARATSSRPPSNASSTSTGKPNGSSRVSAATISATPSPAMRSASPGPAANGSCSPRIVHPTITSSSRPERASRPSAA